METLEKGVSLMSPDEKYKELINCYRVLFPVLNDPKVKIAWHKLMQIKMQERVRSMAYEEGHKASIAKGQYIELEDLYGIAEDMKRELKDTKL